MVPSARPLELVLTRAADVVAGTTQVATGGFPYSPGVSKHPMPIHLVRIHTRPARPNYADRAILATQTAERLSVQKASESL